jgi:hypothetical protein
MKCGSKEHKIKDCKSDPVLTDTKDASENPKPKGKDSEKKVAAVDRSKPEPEKPKEHVASAYVGKIFEGDSDDKILDLDLVDLD